MIVKAYFVQDESGFLTGPFSSEYDAKVVKLYYDSPEVLDRCREVLDRCRERAKPLREKVRFALERSCS